MGMGIYQPGHDRTVFRVKPLGVRIFFYQINCRPGLDNGIIKYGDTAVFDRCPVLILEVKIAARNQKIGLDSGLIHCFSINTKKPLKLR